MDSKLRRMAILSSLAAILLVALLVIYANRDKLGNGDPRTADAGQTAAAGTDLQQTTDSQNT